ncbi:hypothetical protein [Salipiger mangrovisoli]|uniref:Transposase n=1 Tax=Salipiger mangrovisoli TaxID=2865933 RepID=A0ABR9X5E3_9RHOB|nr:hypothetical protein [Salipiger mangrovisoli]MBE9638757.1 hypothetical protein [Salipiger mangrovisoli]
MPKDKCTDEQIAFPLRQAKVGTAIGEKNRKVGAAEARLYRWKKLTACMGWLRSGA